MFTVIVGVLFIAAGTFFIAFGFREREKAVESQQWIAGIATIIRSRVAVSGDGEDRTYSSDVAYEFTVNGMKHLGTCVKPGDSIGLSWKGPAEEIVARYPRGATVTVYFDPADPRRCVLEQTPSRTTIYSILFGVVFVAAGALSLGLVLFP
jgi:hypothetical protein